jgi:hypothetical protein
MRRALTIAGLVVAVAGAGEPGAAAELQPLVWGWESHFTVDWQSVEHRGQSMVAGYVTNVSPYETTQVRLLVESLDGAGRVTAQKVTWVPGDLLGGGRAYFQVPTAPAPAYRVRVFSYDRTERDSTFR